MTSRVVLLLLWAFGGAALAADLDPQLAAKIQREQKKALERIDRDHGNRPSSALSGEERRQVIRQQAAAQQAVLDKHGVEAKAFARYTARLSLEDRAKLAEAEKALEEKEKADAATPEPAPAEVSVQLGFSDRQPVETKVEGAPPIVEHGLPTDGS